MSPTKLENIIGCTACSRSLALNQNSGLICYPAGSAIVLVNPFSQSRINLISPGKCHLTCVAWSPCGQFIATGEFGTDPKVRIWTPKNCKTEPECELGWHKLGISCVGFSADSDLLISVGNNHDKQIIVWEWKTKRKLAESRLTCQVNAMAQSVNGRMFVTVGVRHVKFWYIERNGEDNNSLLLQGRSAILSEQRNNTFIACCCLPSNKTFVLTLTKLLIEFIDKKLVNLYQMGDEVPLALSSSLNLIFIGFWNGTIRIIDTTNMQLLMELPKPLPLQKYSKEDCERITTDTCVEEELKFPDVHSIVFHATSNVLSALYSDRSLYHWQLNIPNEIEGQLSTTQNTLKLSSQHFHVGPIFDVETFNNVLFDGANDFFLTAGADETVRFWSLLSSSQKQQINNNNNLNLSISPELKKVLFLSTESGLLTEQLDKNFGGLLSDSLESTTGVRCLRLSPGGEHLACGRKNGNICIFDLKQINWPLLVEFEAHEDEILCLDYSNNNSNNLIFASSSRDRLIHLFDVKQNYLHLLTLDEHKGPITTLKFIKSTQDSPLLLISFSVDQVLISREIIIDYKTTNNNNFISTKILLKIDKWPIEKIPNCLSFIENKTILIGCNCLLYEIDPINGQLLRTLNENNLIFGSKFEEEEEQGGGIRITKICVDPSGTFAAILCSNKSIHLLDLKEEKCAEIISNNCDVIGLPSDCVTGLAFLPDCSRLLLVTYSGCIAVWRLSTTIQKRILPKISLQKASPDNSIITTTPEDEKNNIFSSEQKFFSSKLANTNFIEHPQISTIFSSLNSTNIIVAKRPSTLQEADDELDSGIGGGEGSSNINAASTEKKLQQSFEIKRVNPLDASCLFSKQQESGEQSLIEGEEVINSMLSSSPMTRPQRPNPSNPHNNNNNVSSPSQNNKQQHFFQQNRPIQNTPPLQQQQQFSHLPLLYTHPTQQQKHLLNVHQTLQQQQQTNKNSRSMSNLNSTTNIIIGQQQQIKERRKWNIGANNSQQKTQQMFLQNNNGRVASSPSHPSPTSFLSVRPIQQSLTTKDILNSNFLISNGNNQQQQYFGGIGNSVSLNTIRSEIIEKKIPQEYDNRDSLSKHFLQTNNINFENDKREENNYCVWKPNNNNLKNTMLIKKRRSSNLFNTSGNKEEEQQNYEAKNNNNNSFIVPQTTTSLIASSSPCSSSQASTPSGITNNNNNDYRHSPDGLINNNNIQNFDQKFGGGGGGSGGARLALNKIKQRRMAAAVAANNNNFDQLPPSSLGRQTPTTQVHLPRSRSQSPSQLAMALLASEAAAAQNNIRPQSPSVRSVLSGSSPSTTSSRYQLKNSINSSSKLRQARQRLKKSQENLFGLKIEGGINLIKREGEEEEEEPLSRSRSIGNLWMTTTARRRTSINSNDDRTQKQQQNNNNNKNHREIAKSVTNLLGEQQGNNNYFKNKEEENNRRLKLGKLTESRQRLAQSIKDIRRISEPDIQPMILIPKKEEENNDNLSETPNTFRGGGGGCGGLRRGVQKKLDKQWQQQISSSPVPPIINARTYQHFNSNNPIDESSSFSSSFNNKITTGIRSATSLTPITTKNNNNNISSSAHSPRSNYLAQKLACRGVSGITFGDLSSATFNNNNKKETSIINSELNQASNNLNSIHFISTGSKRMALHAQECIREMQQASDKLLGTRQLINYDSTIDSEEKSQLLFNVNKAVNAFSKRLAYEEEENGEEKIK